MKKHLAYLMSVIIALVLAFVSCSGGNKTIAVTGVTLNKSEVTLIVGAQESLTATVQPSNATDKNVLWTSSNNAVATVNNGVVTTMIPGTATINVITQDGGKTASCNVSVLSTHEDGQVKSLRLSPKSSPMNLVFLGDGFLDVDSAFFDSKVAELSNYIFSIQPFGGYEEYFSVYSVFAVSSNRGAKTNPSDTWPNTAFNSTYNYMGTERLLVARDTQKVREYARFATPDPHLIVVIVNDTRYGGSGGQFAVTSIHSSAKEIAIHEVGHIFSLADEYVDEQYRQAAGITLASARYRPNVDLTNNLSQIKWNHFIGLSGYNDSAWEGGYYFSTGVWRPTEHSIMRSYAIMAFNAISRETIVKAIINNAGEVYSFSDFLRRDIPPIGLRMLAGSGSDNPMPVPVEFYAEQLYGGQKIRARFKGEDD